MGRVTQYVVAAMILAVLSSSAADAQGGASPDGRAIKATGFWHPMNGGAYWGAYEQPISEKKLVTIVIGGYDYYAPETLIDEWGDGIIFGAFIKNFSEPSHAGGYFGYGGGLVIGSSDWYRYSGGVLAEYVHSDFVGPAVFVLGGYRYAMPENKVIIEPLAMAGMFAGDGDIVPLVGFGCSLGFMF